MYHTRRNNHSIRSERNGSLQLAWRHKSRTPASGSKHSLASVHILRGTVHSKLGSQRPDELYLFLKLLTFLLLRMGQSVGIRFAITSSGVYHRLSTSSAVYTLPHHS